MDWLNFGKFYLMGKWWFWEILTEPMNGYLCTPFVEGLGHHVVHWFFICLNFILGFPFGFSTYLFFSFFDEPRKGNNIIYNHFRRCAFRLPPQTWYFFNWSILVGSVKGFASKSINLTLPLEYICLIIYGPAQFCLNFPFVSWIGARISFSTKSPNFKSVVLTFLSKAFLSHLW